MKIFTTAMANSLDNLLTSARSIKRGFFGKGERGFPSVAFVDEQRVIIGDWTGHLVLFDLLTMQVAKHVFVGDMGGLACSTLASIDVYPALNICIASTRGRYAALWNYETGKTKRLLPQAEEPVNTVCAMDSLRGQGECFTALLGLGYYPLNPGKFSGAHLERYRVTSSLDFEFQDACMLPGTAVDFISPTFDEELLCVSGLRSQTGSFIARLRAEDLRMTLCQESNLSHVRSAHSFSEDNTVVVSAEDITEYRSGEVTEFPRAMFIELDTRPGIYSAAFDHLADAVLLNTGEFYQLVEQSNQVKRFSLPAGCSALAFDRSYGLVAVSGFGEVWHIFSS